MQRAGLLRPPGLDCPAARGPARYSVSEDPSPATQSLLLFWQENSLLLWSRFFIMRLKFRFVKNLNCGWGEKTGGFWFCGDGTKCTSNEVIKSDPLGLLERLEF